MVNDLRIFDETKNIELDANNLDMNLGYLINDVLIHHFEAVEGRKEKGHYEVIAEYDNGGKDIVWVIDEPGIEAVEEHDEEEPIQIYKLYTEDELREKQNAIKLEVLLEDLKSSDYKALKYAEGYYTEEEYKPIREYRESLREQIRDIIDNKDKKEG